MVNCIWNVKPLDTRFIKKDHYETVRYGKILFNDADPDSILLIFRGGGVKTLTIYKKKKKKYLHVTTIII